MKKTKLVVDYNYDFLLIGITTPLKGYKLAWELNKYLTLKLKRQEDVCVEFKDRTERIFPTHTHESSTSMIKLLRNKPTQSETGKYYLAPEYPHFDYLLMVRQCGDSFTNTDLIETIRKISSIELVAFIPLETLKTKENFIF